NRKSGRIYDQFEDQQAAPVVVLGAAVKESIFGKENATGKFIHLYREKSAFLVQVIGVLEEKGGAQAEMVDRNIFLPPKTLSKIAASQPPNNTALAAVLRNEDQAPIARNEIKTLLKSQFPNGVQISDARETIERSKELWEKQNLVGLALALLSLLTGGVGIMNIMLLSIAQRSKEIGLRKAVGARDSHILIQFLLEAVILCLVGGVLGILFGVFFGQQVASLMGQWQATTSMMTIGVALAFSMMVGIGFGLLPAMRAARLDPYEALRT
ncbi:MAG: ABC transporter permease, partial [Deltaproteobacteria bacterium]